MERYVTQTSPRSKHKRRRVARAVGLPGCDSPMSSSGGAAIERNTTVDFIVPGEMELTTAVRSVSNATMAR